MVNKDVYIVNERAQCTEFVRSRVRISAAATEHQRLLGVLSLRGSVNENVNGLPR